MIDESKENQLKEENFRLKSSVEELSILNDIATAIASTQSLDQITNLIVKKCVKYLKSEQGSIDPLRFDQQLSDLMLTKKKPLIINEFKHEE